VQPWSGRCKGDRAKTTFYVLKAKPTGWRLYFTASDPARREIVFLYAVNKKRNARDQKDFKKLCRHGDRLVSGDAEVFVVDIDIPPR
ncbi:MAG: hypothetical protein ACREMU_02160, partial [Gemmatimonadaceae bacterium]